MKRIIAAATVLLIALAGCGGKKDIPQNAMRDDITGKQVRLGMSREEAESVLGKYSNEINGNYEYCDDTIQVRYRDGNVIELSLYKTAEGSERWKLNGGIGVGTPVEDVRKFFGYTDSEVFFMPQFDNEGNQVETGVDGGFMIMIMIADDLVNLILISGAELR